MEQREQEDDVFSMHRRVWLLGRGRDMNQVRETPEIMRPLAAGAATAGPLAISRSSSSSKSWRLGHSKFVNALRLLFNFFPLPTLSCGRWLALPPGPSDSPAAKNIVIGTLYGYRKGHVHFAVQEDPRLSPIVLLELATPTSNLVKEMSSGLVRIALECEKQASDSSSRRSGLFQEPIWSMFCNGRKTGYAMRRACGSSDIHMLSVVQSVSMGAGVVPVDNVLKTGERELMYMRAKFERVVGSDDSEALYMMDPEGNGPPELSIYFLRI